MAEYRIDAQLFRDMVVAAANYLEHNKKVLNDLNVFPVPDGDTGTNMSLTLTSAAREVNACDSDKVGQVMQALSGGALKGARGNSGVILSQLFRGFAKSVSEERPYLVAEDFAVAMEMGVKAAYKAVMKPKEGTILTVAKGMAEEARRQVEAGANLLALIDGVIEAGQETLAKTPELLPVLKEAGVVDAGGAGLLVIYKGFKMAIDGEEITQEIDLTVPERRVAAASLESISTADIQFGYCTEFFVIELNPNVNEESVEKLRDKLSQIGDSVVVVGDSDLIKVHVHTNVPGKALQYALRLGQLSNVKIDNMRQQHKSLTGLAPVEPQKPMAMVAVTAGQGLTAIFKDFNVDEVVEGGQSMNPSAEDILAAVQKAPSDHVIVLLNNKNIQLAAEQAGKLTEKTVVVIPTKSFPQGLSAVLAFNGEVSWEENLRAMKEAIGTVKSAEVTNAVRDTTMNGEHIEKGEVLGILEGDIVTHGAELDGTVLRLVDKMVDGSDDAVITLYYGEAVAENAAEALGDKLADRFEDCDVDVYAGNQALYDYIISVE